MLATKKEQIKALLKSIETGDPESIAVVDEAKYIQHNPQTLEGSEGLAALFKRLSKTSPRVNIVRAFEDGDFVFAHTEYDFASRKIGFEVFRFEEGRAVEHWDNIQERLEPVNAEPGMVDGPAESTDHHLTETNRTLVRSFVETVFIDQQLARLPEYVDEHSYTEHDPRLSGGITGLQSGLASREGGVRPLDYQRVHRVLAEGDFVLCVSEGLFEERHSAFYDLFRIAGGKIVEHWDTIEKIAPVSQWKNKNGKF